MSPSTPCAPRPNRFGLLPPNFSNRDTHRDAAAWRPAPQPPRAELMPIRKELRPFYGLEWRTVIRPRILARAGDCCEQCGKPNHAFVFSRTGKQPGRYLMEWKPTVSESSEIWCLHSVDSSATGHHFRPARALHVVLTIAHLNHTAGDDRDENLAALCQWCHLILDLEHHHRTRADRKDAERPMLIDSTQ
jgi:hypothetical protein